MTQSGTSLQFSRTDNPILDKNLHALSVNNAELANVIAGIKPDSDDPDFPGWKFEVRDAKNGQPTLVAISESSEVAVHSLYDPEREASDQVKGILANEKRNYFVILGFGLGYAVEKLVANLDDDDKVLVVEPHLTAFRNAIEIRDVSKLLTDPRIVISFSNKVEEALSAFIARYHLANTTGVGFIECAGRSRLPSAQLFADFLERLKGVFITSGGNLQTLMLMAWTYQKNTMASMGHIVNSPPVRTLFNAFEGKPGIIVSAGPSLKKNIDQLKELKDRAVIIAVDTSVRPLQNAGIEPHLICTGDPQEANYKHLKGTTTSTSHLIAEPMTYSTSMEMFSDRLFIASYEDKVMRWIENFIPEVGHTMCWGSVATMAFDVARKMGCDPIIFIGQDLSFPGGRTYVEGTYFETEEKRDMTVEAFEKDRRTVIQTDIYGQPVKTTRQMFAYKEWFRGEFNNTDAHIVNATEGGILTEFCEIITLKEAAEKYLTENFDAMEIINSRADGFEGYHLNPLLKGLKENLESITRIVKYCDQGIDRIRTAVNLIETQDRISEKWAAIQLGELDKLRFQMMEEPAMNEFIVTANQAGVLNFKRKYRVLNGKEYSRVVFREALDLFTNFYMSTGKTARGVLPFHAIGYKILAAKLKSQESNTEEEICLSQ